MSQSEESAGDIFDAVIEMPKEQRAAFLEKACGGNDPLRQRVEALLRAHEVAQSFMNDPAQGMLSTTIRLSPPNQSGQMIGRYKLLQQIGEGGCGIVYMAEQTEPVRRRVALKVIKLGMDTKSVIARFEAERQALALMDHPNIAKVLDAGASETGRPYFVMELVKGIPISRYCDEWRLDTAHRLRLFVQVCRAVQHAHQKSIIHRDLKPTNILVADHDGVPVPKVIDFGIAKATSDQRLTDKTLFTAFEQFIGTAAYMSPEQANLSGLDIDTRSDIYSLGVLLYELLTGKTPIESKRLIAAGLDEVRRIILQEEPTRPSTRLSTMVEAELTATARQRQTDSPKLVHLIRGDLDWIVMKALEKDRGRRYETANGLAMDVERHLKGEPVVARPASAAYRIQKMVRRNKLAFAAGAAVVAALIIGLGISILSVIQTKHALAWAKKEEKAETVMRLKADEEAMKARIALTTSDCLEAERLTQADDDEDAVAYLMRVLTLDPGNAEALTQLCSLLTYQTWMVPVLFLPHEGKVNSAQFSPDGTCIVTASMDKTAQVWDTETGRPLMTSLLHNSPVISARFSLDGSRIFTTTQNHMAAVWDARSGQPTMEPMTFTGSLEFSRDGRSILSYAGNKVAVWDVETRQPLTSISTDRDNVESAKFSPDGARVLTLTRIFINTNLLSYSQFNADGTRVQDEPWEGVASLWDARTGRLIGKPLRHAKPINFAQFSPDGKQVVTASDDGTARVWDAQTGLPLTGPLKHAGSVNFAQFSPDGKRLVTVSDDHTARVWDTRTGQQLTPLLMHASQVLSAQFSPDGTRIVTATTDNIVRVWDAQSGQQLTEPWKHGEAVVAPTKSNEDTVITTQFSPDGTRILTANEDNKACVWAAQAGWPQTERLKHADAVLTAQFSPDGTRIVTASADSSARVWDAQNGQPLVGPLQHQLGVSSAQFSPDGKRVLTCSFDNTARVWDAKSGLPLTPPMRHQAALYFAEFSPDGTRIATASQDATAGIWDARTGLRLTTMRHSSIVNSARFSRDGKYVVTASADHTAQVWDAQTGLPVTKRLQHASDVFNAQFSPDGKYVVTASGDNTAWVWDAHTGQHVTGPLQSGNAVTVAQFSPEGSCVLTASDDYTVRVWERRTGFPMAEPMKHRSALISAQFSPDGGRIVTGSGDDNTARVWDARTGHPLTEPLKHAGPVVFTQFSPDGRRIVTASHDGSARVWDVGLAPPKCPAWLLQLAEAVGGKRIYKEAILMPTSLDRAQTIDKIRQRLNEQPDNADGVAWGRWLLADRFNRTISPLSSMTVTSYIEIDINECTAESLAEAARLAVGHPELYNRILEKQAALKQHVDTEDEAAELAARGELRAAESKYLEGTDSSRALWPGLREKWAGSFNGYYEVLKREAQDLGGEGKWSEAELKYREMWRARQVIWPDEFRTWEDSLDGLLDVLKREGKLSEIEKVFHDLFSMPPPLQVVFRAQYFALHGRWKEAAADYTSALGMDTSDDPSNYILGPLLVQTGDWEGYRKYGTRVLAHFAGTNDPGIANQMAKQCLIAPVEGIDLFAVAQLAETAVTKGNGHERLPYFEFTKSLSEYRLGRFAAAADWAQKALAAPVVDEQRNAQAWLVLAMTLHQSGQDQQSRAALAKGSDIINTKLPKLENGDLIPGWPNWIVCHALLKEAKALIERANSPSQ